MREVLGNHSVTHSSCSVGDGASCERYRTAARVVPHVSAAQRRALQMLPPRIGGRDTTPDACDMWRGALQCSGCGTARVPRVIEVRAVGSGECACPGTILCPCRGGYGREASRPPPTKWVRKVRESPRGGSAARIVPCSSSQGECGRRKRPFPECPHLARLRPVLPLRGGMRFVAGAAMDRPDRSASPIAGNGTTGAATTGESCLM